MAEADYLSDSSSTDSDLGEGLSSPATVLAENNNTPENGKASSPNHGTNLSLNLSLGGLTPENVRGRPAKNSLPRAQPDELCNCPQRCGERIPPDVKVGLYKEFIRLGDHYRQNLYLQSWIEMRTVYKRPWAQEERVGGRLQRRVSCKYRIPLRVPTHTEIQDALAAAIGNPVPRLSPALTTNAKGRITFVVQGVNGVSEGMETTEVCQKAFMNTYAITEKRIRLQREKLIARLRGEEVTSRSKAQAANAAALLAAAASSPAGRLSVSASSSPSSSSSTGVGGGGGGASPFGSLGSLAGGWASLGLSTVDTFFQNQLWKPQYIGISAQVTTAELDKLLSTV